MSNGWIEIDMCGSSSDEYEIYECTRASHDEVESIHSSSDCDSSDSDILEVIGPDGSALSSPCRFQDIVQPPTPEMRRKKPALPKPPPAASAAVPRASPKPPPPAPAAVPRVSNGDLKSPLAALNKGRRDKDRRRAEVKRGRGELKSALESQESDRIKGAVKNLKSPPKKRKKKQHQQLKGTGKGGKWIYDASLGGEIFVEKGSKSCAKAGYFATENDLGAGASSAQAEMRFSRNGISQNQQRAHSSSFSSYCFDGAEDAEAEQERLFKESKARVEARKASEAAAAASKSFPSSSSTSLPVHVRIDAPCSILPNSTGPPLPPLHHLSPNLYYRLGLPESSSHELVRKHYKRLALMYHPDKCNPASRSEYSEIFHRIKEAYEMLGGK